MCRVNPASSSYTITLPLHDLLFRTDCLNVKSSEERVVYKALTQREPLIQKTTMEAPQRQMYYVGLDVHKKTISYCVKDASGRIHQEGKIGATRRNWTAG